VTKYKITLIYAEKSRGTFHPACDLSNVLLEFKARGRKLLNLSFVDIVSLLKQGWEVHYSGKKHKMMEDFGAIYEGEVTKETKKKK